MMRQFAFVFALMLMLLTPGAIQAAPAFPDTIPLPNGFQPEGIVSGAGTDFYAGSLANGAIYKGDLRTGQGGILVEGVGGRIAVGLDYDQRSGYLFVAGGPTGTASVYDTRTGAQMTTYQLAGPGAFINDVILTRQAAYFTVSNAPNLYVLPLGPGGALPAASEVKALTLSGDWSQVSGFNANGIEASPNGDTLIVVNSTLGILYRVDPATGVADAIELAGGATVTAGDGLLLDGKTLYVVRNRLNQIAAVRLSPDFTSGEVTGAITSPLFRVPTTVTEHGNSLYAVNARFGTPPGPTVDYDVVRVGK
jgi:sugar lactone lactonase YvrE